MLRGDFAQHVFKHLYGQRVSAWHATVQYPVSCTIVHLLMMTIVMTYNRCVTWMCWRCAETDLKQLPTPCTRYRAKHHKHRTAMDLGTAVNTLLNSNLRKDQHSLDRMSRHTVLADKSRTYARWIDITPQVAHCNQPEYIHVNAFVCCARCGVISWLRCLAAWKMRREARLRSKPRDSSGAFHTGLATFQTHHSELWYTLSLLT